VTIVAIVDGRIHTHTHNVHTKSLCQNFWIEVVTYPTLIKEVKKI